MSDTSCVALLNLVIRFSWVSFIIMSSNYVGSQQISIHCRYLNGACKTKVKFFGQETAAGT